MMPTNLRRLTFSTAKSVDRAFHRAFSSQLGPLANPLFGDRSIEYAFVIEQLRNIERTKTVLDVGCSGSPLTTIIRSIGFKVVHGIDLLPSPVEYEGVEFYQGDFVSDQNLHSKYDVVIFCSSIEHFGLSGRYGSHEQKGGDVLALEKAYSLLPPSGLVVLTIPYGVEKVVFPLHRVYGTHSKLLQFAFDRFKPVTQQYYRRDLPNVWRKCAEEDASRVIPTASSYALGLLSFQK
jgi:SAM-dependent methyltransferase